MNFKFTTSGESHGKALVSIVEGMPSGVEIDIERLNHELWRRQQGYGRGGRMKIESDKAEILSGVRHGKTLGSPIALLIENRDFVHWTEIMSSEPIETPPKNPRIVTRPASRTRRFSRRLKISNTGFTRYSRTRFGTRNCFAGGLRCFGKTASGEFWRRN